MTKMGNVVRQLLFVLTTILGSAGAVLGQPATSGLLQLEAKIPLGAVSGRIDHMDSTVVAVIPRKFPKEQATQGSAPSGQTHDPASQGDEAETGKKP